MAQLCLCNAIEKAQETESAIMLGSFDKYRAFDSLTHADMKIAYHIAGLSEEEAARLVGVEEDSHVTVATPLARHHWSMKYARTIYPSEGSGSEPSFFMLVTGTPQGDTISCLTWTVFENICLAALCKDPCNVNLYIRGANGLI